MNFINSWLAEPFEQVSSTADADRILSLQGRYTRGVVPEETILITGGVDKQRDRYYYTVRAWGENRRSWNIDHGQVESEADLVEAFDRPWHDERGGEHYIHLVLVDSGDDTDTVYDFCYLHQGLFAPVKGSSTALTTRFRESVIEKEDSRAKGMRLILCDGAYYKDMIFRRITGEKFRDWLVFDGCDEEYAKQIASEHKVAETVGGRTVYKWKPKRSGIDNHYLDCEVYAACAADVMYSFGLLAPAEAEAAPPPAQAGEQAEDDWIGGGDTWL